MFQCKKCGNSFFPWEPNPSADLAVALQNIAMIPIHFTVYATPMWYVYTLIGLYLYMPIFSAWVEKASDRAKRWFLLAWYIRVDSEKIRRALANLTVCGFGIYCVHYFFVGPSYLLVKFLGVPLALMVPASTIIAFACSWSVVYLLSKLPKAKYIIG